MPPLRSKPHQQLHHGRLCSNNPSPSILAGGSTWSRWGHELPATTHRKTGQYSRREQLIGAAKTGMAHASWQTGKVESGKVESRPQTQD